MSYETIYRRLWANKKTGGTLHSHLRHKIGAYRKRCVNYKMDTVIGLQSGPILVTIVDRRSHRTLIAKASDKSAH